MPTGLAAGEGERQAPSGEDRGLAALPQPLDVDHDVGLRASDGALNIEDGPSRAERANTMCGCVVGCVQWAQTRSWDEVAADGESGVWASANYSSGRRASGTSSTIRPGRRESSAGLFADADRDDGDASSRSEACRSPVFCESPCGSGEAAWDAAEVSRARRS
jgi:hypothetical protein